MTLTLQLGQTLQGEKLVEIVERAMSKLDGWNTKTKKKVQHAEGHVGAFQGVLSKNVLGCSLEPFSGYCPNDTLFDFYIPSNGENNMVLCATRYCGKGKKVLLADQIFE
ncbi:MAG: hypothetical protein KJ771_07315, partial [Nanoarchaeota archaeon]|nr:hypothetical protein [Nanoarchaeota archaeon]